MSYVTLLISLLPDLIVVVGIFLALGLDYTWLRARDVADRNRIIARVATWSLFLGLGGIAAQPTIMNIGDGMMEKKETLV